MKLCFSQICGSDHFPSRTCVELCLFFHLGKRAFTLWKSCYFGTRENRFASTTAGYRSGFVCRVAASRLIYSWAKLGKFSRRFARSQLYNLSFSNKRLCRKNESLDLKTHIHLINLENVGVFCAIAYFRQFNGLSYVSILSTFHFSIELQVIRKGRSRWHWCGWGQYVKITIERNHCQTWHIVR